MDTFKLNIDDQIITCRTFTLDEYSELLAAKANGTLNQAILSLFAACVKSPVALNKHQSELVLINLWARSIAQEHIKTWVCKCGKEHPVKLDFSQAYIPDTELPTYRIGNAVLNLRYPKLFEDSNKFDMVTSCIEGISIGSENLTLEELTTQEQDELVQAITLEIASEIADLLTKPKPIMGVPITCECGEHSVHVIEGLKNFFRLF
ncbi:baseplate hub [Serratia phage 92A1]|nr:baseplate hub [Serratia phage 92A1]